MTKRLNFLVQKNAGIEALVAVEAWLAKTSIRSCSSS